MSKNPPKPAIIQQVDFAECALLGWKVNGDGFSVHSVRITHPSLKTPRWFYANAHGNFVWRDTDTRADRYARCYILTPTISVMTAWRTRDRSKDSYIGIPERIG